MRKAAVARPNFHKVIPTPLLITTPQKASGWNRRPAPIHTKPEVMAKLKLYTGSTETHRSKAVNSATWTTKHTFSCGSKQDTERKSLLLLLRDRTAQRMLCNLSHPLKSRDFGSQQAWQGNTHHPIQSLCLGATEQQQWRQQQHRRGQRQQHQSWFCCPSSTQNKNAPYPVVK